MGLLTAVDTPDLVRQIAEAVFKDQLLVNWKFYALVGGTTFLAQVVWQISAPYLQRRSEIAATKADMDEILRQVAETTRVTEEVRSNVSQAEWVSREWRTIRRLKLEELLTIANTLEKWTDEAMDKFFYENVKRIHDFPSDDLEVIGILYFPELRDQVYEVSGAFLDLYKVIIEHAPRISEANKEPNSEESNNMHAKFYKEYGPMYSAAMEHLSNLQDMAGEQMAKLAQL